ncbi:glycosyltransferase family 2 protein [Pseudobutyrivibrio sp.]|uniref:glycosyltransferase family 2 protein n=1 Tax=Pseudobutyrivibrio sp. TaxID=2014367 RepID=UPI001B7A27DB|nr:glycosyltransferase family A protein [Pseudobutyrivibrio sp.]MBP3262937.1 glycosyltransferase family 2 protein [Pseudobutyrivibrio sp.]
MNVTPKISVVISTYNAQNYISECLDATLNQTYTNLEVIIVDDGSEDDTLSILQSYASKDSRITLFRHSNKGVSTTRNKGIQNATGEYIVFFDADDYPEPDLIEAYVNAINEWSEKKVALIGTGMFFDNQYNKYVGNKTYILEVAHGYIEGENYILSRSSAAMLAWLKLFNFVTNKCYDLDIIRKHNILFDSNIHIGEDLKFNLDYLDVEDGNIGIINRALYHYVKRTNNSLSVSYHNMDLEDTKAIYKRFINWEVNQKDVTVDNVMVVKAIFINDWISRLTALYEEHRHEETFASAKKTLKNDIQSVEFQRMLKEIYRAKKISTLRYVCLRTGIFEIFYFFRFIYQILKG